MGWGDGGWGGGGNPVGFRVGVETYSLDPGVTGKGQGGFIYSGGNAATPYKATIAPLESGSKITEFLMAMRSSEGNVGGKFLADLVNTTSWLNLEATARGWTIALENNTASAVDADGVGGNVAQIDGASANVGVMLRRIRATRTTLVDSLRGWVYVVGRAKMTGVGSWKTKLGWSPSLADPVANFNDPYTHTVASGTTAFGYVEIPLGYVKVPESGSLGGIALEVHAQRLSGTGNLNLDLLRLLPATPGKDVLTRIAVPGGSSETWLGSELVTPVTNPAGGTAGVVVGTSLHLNTSTDNAGTSPNAGFAWPVGRHRITFTMFFNGNGDEIPSALLRVRNITDSNDAASVIRTAGTKSAVTRSGMLEFDSVAGKSYQPQVDDPGFTGSNVVRVERIEHTFIPALGQNEQAHTEPENGVVHKRDASGNHIGNLSTEGEVPFYLPSGLAAVFAVPLDVPLAGYTEPQSVKARTVTFSAAGAPRYNA